MSIFTVFAVTRHATIKAELVAGDDAVDCLVIQRVGFKPSDRLRVTSVDLAIPFKVFEKARRKLRKIPTHIRVGSRLTPVRADQILPEEEKHGK